MTTRNWLNQQDKTVNLELAPYVIEKIAFDDEIFNHAYSRYIDEMAIHRPYDRRPVAKTPKLNTVGNKEFINQQRFEIGIALPRGEDALYRYNESDEYACINIKAKTYPNLASDTLRTMLFTMQTKQWTEYITGVYRVPGFAVRVSMASVSETQVTCVALGGLYFDDAHGLFVRPLAIQTHLGEEHSLTAMIYYDSKQLEVENQINKFFLTFSQLEGATQTPKAKKGK